MGQTMEGAAKLAARAAGVSLAQYQQRLATQEKYCSGCREWHLRSQFGSDASRGDGLSKLCSAARNRAQRERYQPRPIQRRQRRVLVARRDGDKLQARRRVNFLVEQAYIPRPGTLRCLDCGAPANQYDHHLGYDAVHHEDVEPVCQGCHTKREMRRGAWGRQQA